MQQVRKRKTSTIWYYLYVESTIGTNKPVCETETDLQLPMGRRGGRSMDWEFGVDKCKLLHLEWIDNKVGPNV